MVGVKFQGRLGNQLFQYYFLLYLKSRNRRLIYFFPNPHHACLTKYFDLGWYHNLTLGSKLYSVVMRLIPRIPVFREVFVHNFVSPRPVEVRNFTIYNGYFQSDYYLRQLPSPRAIRIREKYTREFEEKFGDIFRRHKTVVVHVRRTDYLAYGKRDISLPVDYFKRQLYAIRDLDTCQVFFVSDDLDFLKKEFPPRPNFVFSGHSEILDFQLIMHADIAIISNSTFAWWAAWLSPKNNLVIAPRNWMGFRIGREHPRGIMTDRFTWREVADENAAG